MKIYYIIIRKLGSAIKLSLRNKTAGRMGSILNSCLTTYKMMTRDIINILAFYVCISQVDTIAILQHYTINASRPDVIMALCQILIILFGNCILTLVSIIDLFVVIDSFIFI